MEMRIVLLINSCAGMLSQKAKDTDLSLVGISDRLSDGYGALQNSPLRSFSPRARGWTRNTSGIVAAGKSLAGLTDAFEVFRTGLSTNITSDCLRTGPEARTVDGWLLKDPRTNQVKILSRTDLERESGS